MSDADLEALHEVAEAGGARLWSLCRFSFVVAFRLEELGLVTIGDVPPMQAEVRLTDLGWSLVRHTRPSTSSND